MDQKPKVGLLSVELERIVYSINDVGKTDLPAGIKVVSFAYRKAKLRRKVHICGLRPESL